MKTSLALGFLSLSLLVGGQSRPQTPQETISIGAIQLTIGIPQDRVLAQFAEFYTPTKITESDDSSAWSFWTKEKRPRLVGSVIFRHRKLIKATKEWYLEDDSSRGAELASAIYGAISDFISEGKHSCSIDAQFQQGPGDETRTVNIVCGGKYIRIIAAKHRGLPIAQVDEGFTSSPVGN